MLVWQTSPHCTSTSLGGENADESALNKHRPRRCLAGRGYAERDAVGGVLVRQLGAGRQVVESDDRLRFRRRQTCEKQPSQAG
jgi:hypothetical protein